MQDIMDKLQHILNSKEGQEQLKNIASMLNTNGSSNDSNSNTNNNDINANSNTNTGFDSNSFFAQGNQPNNSQNGFDISSLASMLSGLQGGGNSGNPLADTLGSFVNNSSNNNNPENSNTQSGFPNIDMNMIMGIQKAFSAMNVNDKNTQLLIALKPHFSSERSKKVDQALGLMRLMTALPALKDSGILSGIL